MLLWKCPYYQRYQELQRLFHEAEIHEQFYKGSHFSERELEQKASHLATQSQMLPLTTQIALAMNRKNFCARPIKSSFSRASMSIQY